MNFHKYLKRMYSAVLLVILAITFNACAVEEEIQIKADFTIKVSNDDYSVPVKVEIINKSTGADTYEWSFEGATVTSSTEKNPQPIIYAEAGVYKIKLKASNKDGNEDEKIVEIKADASMKVDFEWQMQGSDISPVTLQMVDKSLGATQYLWEFAGGIPATSNAQNPTVVFTTPGDHIIKLTISNVLETYSTQKTVTIQPEMTIDFNWSVDPIDNDYEAPLLLHLNNLSTNAFSYEWEITGATPSISATTNPDVNFSSAGTYTIILKATNDKETKILQKQITIQQNTNLLSFSNVKLGINNAHSTIGCFFSSYIGAVIRQGDVTPANGSKIDFGFFGLNSSFAYNQFVSPDEVQNTAFSSIPNATHSKIINSQELVGNQLSISGFNAINAGSDFNSINVTESNAGKTPFNNITVPRIVLFKTEDGRKGAINITDFVSAGTSSYIMVDIKVQKQP
ncbi:PKD domain-containing protein [Chryseobacterium indoltheticum]|uniref:FOG: PKD repeat n=1 Tax=Chryseobacterium indoltheticum TaxID=254 RepID=A0A381F4K4_9FLAO|nr:PKD domain-containing protein [Chryseobacterium indoltheticum]AZA74934.1 PKD domain-containing protein [Chryseobacterium indoltheticum]SIQ29837.1 PKD repeat-containing protein [Chryseobacterium indoltheticum]SUX41384.1 FOG: PKD repeat [Chryseobacterium indoltheticum]